MNAHFIKTPGRAVPRSKHDLSSQVSFTCNVGDLIPAEWWNVYPGDIYDFDVNILARLQTLLAPLMDDISVDVDWFFVPYRLVWDDFREFMGENTKGKYYPRKEVFVPHIKGIPKAKSVLDFVGVPPEKETSVEALIPRAYSLIWNEWYRDEQLQDPVLIDKTSNNHNYDDNNPCYGGQVLKACKYHDYFTSAVPQPQAGDPVSMPLGQIAPVRTDLTDTAVISKEPLRFRNLNGDAVAQNTALLVNGSSAPVNNYLTGANGTGALPGLKLSPSNLYADLSVATASTINDLRLAFATQQFLEINNFGTRYTEIIRNHFGVISPDGRLQRPELLGHFHDVLNISQVVQNSETGTTPLGDVAGLSATYMNGNHIRKAFTEHGVVLALMTFRFKHSYQQGINRELTRLNKYDFYFPVFANLGYQPILNKELYVQGNFHDDEVFGYQERWSELRHKIDRVAGELRSSYKTPLDYWTLQDNYSTQPYLSEKWITEDSAPVNRAIAVSDKVADQLIVNIFFQTSAVRPLPVYSIPGLNRL